MYFEDWNGKLSKKFSSDRKKKNYEIKIWKNIIPSEIEVRHGGKTDFYLKHWNMLITNKAMLIQNNFNVVEKIAMFCTCTFFIIIY